MSESTLIVEKDVQVPMRDGTVLRADIYLSLIHISEPTRRY